MVALNIEEHYIKTPFINNERAKALQHAFMREFGDNSVTKPEFLQPPLPTQKRFTEAEERAFQFPTETPMSERTLRTAQNLSAPSQVDIFTEGLKLLNKNPPNDIKQQILDMMSKTARTHNTFDSKSEKSYGRQFLDSYFNSDVKQAKKVNEQIPNDPQYFDFKRKVGDKFAEAEHWSNMLVGTAKSAFNLCVNIAAIYGLRSLAGGVRGAAGRAAALGALFALMPAIQGKPIEEQTKFLNKIASESIFENIYQIRNIAEDQGKAFKQYLEAILRNQSPTAEMMDNLSNAIETGADVATFKPAPPKFAEDYIEETSRIQKNLEDNFLVKIAKIVIDDYKQSLMKLPQDNSSTILINNETDTLINSEPSAIIANNDIKSSKKIKKNAAIIAPSITDFQKKETKIEIIENNDLESSFKTLVTAILTDILNKKKIIMPDKQMKWNSNADEIKLTNVDDMLTYIQSVNGKKDIQIKIFEILQQAAIEKKEGGSEIKDGEIYENILQDLENSLKSANSFKKNNQAFNHLMNINTNDMEIELTKKTKIIQEITKYYENLNNTIINNKTFREEFIKNVQTTDPIIIKIFKNSTIFTPNVIPEQPIKQINVETANVEAAQTVTATDVGKNEETNIIIDNMAEKEIDYSKRTFDILYETAKNSNFEMDAGVYSILHKNMKEVDNNVKQDKFIEVLNQSEDLAPLFNIEAVEYLKNAADVPDKLKKINMLNFMQDKKVRSVAAVQQIMAATTNTMSRGIKILNNEITSLGNKMQNNQLYNLDDYPNISKLLPGSKSASDSMQQALKALGEVQEMQQYLLDGHTAIAKAVSSDSMLALAQNQNVPRMFANMAVMHKHPIFHVGKEDMEKNPFEDGEYRPDYITANYEKKRRASPGIFDSIYGVKDYKRRLEKYIIARNYRELLRKDESNKAMKDRKFVDNLANVWDNVERQNYWNHGAKADLTEEANSGDFLTIDRQAREEYGWDDELYSKLMHDDALFKKERDLIHKTVGGLEDPWEKPGYGKGIKKPFNSLSVNIPTFNPHGKWEHVSKYLNNMHHMYKFIPYENNRIMQKENIIDKILKAIPQNTEITGVGKGAGCGRCKSTTALHIHSKDKNDITCKTCLGKGITSKRHLTSQTDIKPIEESEDEEHKKIVKTNNLNNAIEKLKANKSGTMWNQFEESIPNGVSMSFIKRYSNTLVPMNDSSDYTVNKIITLLGKYQHDYENMNKTLLLNMEHMIAEYIAEHKKDGNIKYKAIDPKNFSDFTTLKKYFLDSPESFLSIQTNL